MRTVDNRVLSLTGRVVRVGIALTTGEHSDSPGERIH
jgi:hypothetical protein